MASSSSSSRPWSASSPLRKAPSPSSATAPNTTAATTTHQRPHTASATRRTPLAATYVVTDSDVFLQRRLEIREWSVSDLRERLLHTPFFRDTIIATVKMFDADGEPRGIAPCSVAHALELHRVDGAMFMDLTQQDLATYLGIKQLGVLKAILREIQALIERPPVNTANSSVAAATTSFVSSASTTTGDDDADPYAAAWAATRLLPPRPQSAAVGPQQHQQSLTQKRPQSAAMLGSSRAALDPFVLEQRRFMPDIITQPQPHRRGNKRGDADGGSIAADADLGITHDDEEDAAWAARSNASSQRIADLLAASRQRRARPASAPSHAVVMSHATRLQTQVDSTIATGVASLAPWQHDQLRQIAGPQLPPLSPPPPAPSQGESVAAAPVARSPIPSAILQHAAEKRLRDVKSPDAKANVAEDDEVTRPFRPGIMEVERRYQRFSECYQELLLGMEDGVNLGCAVRGFADVLEWDTTTYEAAVHRAYATVRNARAVQRRRKQMRAMGGVKVEAGADASEAQQQQHTMIDDPMATNTGPMSSNVTPASPGALAKHEALIVVEAEFRDVMIELSAASTPTEVDHVLKHLSDLFGDAQRERVRRSRDIEMAMRQWDVAKEGTVAIAEFNSVLANFNAEIAVVSQTLQIQYAWADDMVPYYLGSQAKPSNSHGSSPVPPPASPSQPQPSSSSELVRLIDVQPLFLAAWSNAPPELFDEALLGLKTAIDRATKDRLGLAAFATTPGELERAVNRLTHDVPILVAYSTAVSPVLQLQAIAKARGASLIRLNVSSSTSENAAMETIVGKGIAQGNWISIEFPHHAAAIDPLPIPPSLATLLEEEPVDREYRNDSRARGASPSSGRLSRAGSVSSAPSSAGTSRATGLLDSYSGERFTGAMVAFLRRVAMAVTTAPYFRRHVDFRLFCHAPIDFDKIVEIPALLRPIAILVPLLGLEGGGGGGGGGGGRPDDALRRAVSPHHVPTPGRLPSRLQRALMASGQTPGRVRGAIDPDTLDEQTPGRERRMAAALVATVLDFDH